MGRVFRTPLALLTAILISSWLVSGVITASAPVQYAIAPNATVIGIGGRDDPAAARIPDKLRGKIGPPDHTYIPSFYPASLNMIDSVRVGMPILREHLAATTGAVILVGYSEGTLLTEQIKRDLDGAAVAPDPGDLSFLEIAAPFIPNGGILARFPFLGIPGMIPAMGVAAPSVYGTTYVTMEYDTYADFPAYFNPLALLNTLLAAAYAHPDPFYDPIDLDSAVLLIKEITKPGGVMDRYVLVPNEHLPLFGPLRDVARFLGQSPLAERLIGAVEPLLRVLVDMAYTDRQNLNPQVHQPFSLMTPIPKMVEALRAIPDAVREGLENLTGARPAAANRPEVAPAPPSSESQPKPPQAPTIDPDFDDLGSAPENGRRTSSRDDTDQRDDIESDVENGIDDPTEIDDRSTVVTPLPEPGHDDARATDDEPAADQDERDAGAEAA
ncbi:PE-PPE domain-containing protein [Arthrobacter sp. SLBN-53]|uniref:PE-PPE domain-containing protein n=1 Tax=Arthrobacter sp. SLBN-53 TaxID=2768412 RepID=UPI0011511D49|nr:PE-PPE domain-containing protein [Arthrobacter sp. SLBN-53]TQK29334.1 PE-PPE domain-containing protein [Arthrobacter sp. SLBN-53]